MLNEAGERPVDIDATAENDLDTLAIDRATGGAVPGIGHRLVRHAQSQKMIRLAAVDAARHHPVFKRIEGGEVPQVAAALAVYAVTVGCFRIEKQIRPPVLRRLADRVHTVDD